MYTSIPSSLKILVFDGPEKSGKSTLIESVRERIEQHGRKVRVRRWGPVDNDSVYARPLADDATWDGITIWDRSWVSEHVYSLLLARGRRLGENPWLGEWLYGRTIQNVGLGFIVSGPESRILEERRDNTDLPVSPALEQWNFVSYANRFGWILLNDTNYRPGSHAWTDVIDEIMLYVYLANKRSRKAFVPNYCGPQDAEVIFVMNPVKSRGDQWLPFSRDADAIYGKMLGEDAFKCGWMEARGIPPNEIATAKVVVACGEAARKWAHFYVQPRMLVVLPAPVAFKRQPQEKRELAEKILKQIREYFSIRF